MIKSSELSETFFQQSIDNTPPQKKTDFITKESSEVVIIYHSKDMDGIMSGYLLNLNFLQTHDKIDNIPYNYEKEGFDFITDPTNFIKKYDIIVFADITPPIEFVKDFHAICEKNSFKSKELIILDHHANAINSILDTLKSNDTVQHTNHITNDFMERSIKKNKYVLDKNTYSFNYDDFTSNNLAEYYRIKIYSSTPKDKETNLKTLSGAYITYFYVLDNNFNTLNLDMLKKLVYYISEYDVWNFVDNKEHKNGILALQYGLNNFMKPPENSKPSIYYQKLMRSMFEMFPLDDPNTFESSFQSLLGIGNTLIEKEISSIKTKGNVLLCTNEEYNKLLFVIGESPTYVTQEYFKKLYDSTHIDCIIFTKILFDKKAVTFSARQLSNENFNCATFIEKLTHNNGGGHFASAGGSLNLNQFFDTLSKMNY